MNLKLSTIAASVGMLLAGITTGFSQLSLNITNNSFESPAQSSTHTYIQSTGASTSTYVTGWTTASQSGIWSTLYNQSGTNIFGSQVIEAFCIPGSGYSGQGIVYQQLTNKWVPGATYTMKAYAGSGAGNTAYSGTTFSIDSLNGSTLTQLGSTAISSATTGGLAPYTVTYTSTGTESGSGFVVVAFHSPAQSSSNKHMWIDNFSITQDPAITVPPTSVTATPGANTSFSVTATGGTTVSYQWQATNNATGWTNVPNAGPFSGANTATLSITSAQPAQSLNYQVVVSDTAGSITSSVVSLTVNDPYISAQPVSQTVTGGNNASFSVTASGGSTLSYQWQATNNATGWTNVPNAGVFSGATSATLSITGAQVAQALNYRVVVSDTAGSLTSSVVSLTVNDPVISVQPVAQQAVAGQNASFNVTAAGGSTLSYQWQTNGVNVSNGGNISGATTSTLTLTGVTTNQALNYQVVVTDTAGSITSSVASLTVFPAGTSSLYIANNSFELPHSGSQQIYCSGTPGTYTYVTGWTNVVTSGYWDINLPSGVTNTDGTQVLESYDVGGGLQGYIYQELTNKWVPGAVYTMTARAGQPSGGNPPNTGNTVSIDVNNGGTLTQLSSATISNARSGLANYTVTYTSTGSEVGDGYPVVAYHVPAQSSAGGMWVDDYAITISTAALITGQPASVTNVDGTANSFTVTAQGATLSYQWQANGGSGYTNIINGGNFSGATSNVLSIASATSSTPASYQVVITNYFGSVTSSVVTLSLTPNISTQPPALQATTVGGNTSLSVTADGSPTLTYQWQATNSATGGFTNVPNTAPFSGANTATLSISSATANQALTYQVVVANGYGSVTSTPSVLTVSSAPVITAQPLSQTNNAGANVSFSVTATGTAPLAYQWQASGGSGYTNLSSTGSFSGTTTSNLMITAIADANALSYQVVITNSSGSVTSSPALLTVIDPPVITNQPASQSAIAGGNVTFSVGASGTAPFTYQWQTNGVNVGNGGIVSGATSSTLMLTGVTTNYALNYNVILSNAAGSVTSSPAATLTVHVPPTIVTQPVSAYASPGSTATFSVVAAGDPTLVYQWQSGPAGGPFTNLTDNGQVTGSSTGTLTITNANTPVAILYQVVVTNNYGSATSTAATLTLGTLVDVQFLGQSPSSSGAPGAYGAGSAYSGPAIFGSAGDTWNQESYPYYNQNNPAFNGVSLVNAANVASGLTLTVAGDGNNPVQGAGVNGTVADAATTNLMSAAFWQFGINGAGAYNCTLTIAGLSAYAGDNVQLVVLAGAPSAQTEQIAITGGVNGYSPSGTQTTTSTSRQLSAGAGVAYQIFTNGVLTGGNLTFTVNETGAGNYANAAYINGIQLLIQYPDPAITNQPVSQTKVVGTTATFSVGATGSATLNYQWQATNSASGGFTNLTDIPGVISGSQSNLLTFTGVTANESLTYQVVVSNGSGSVTSTPASLNVLTIPIINTQPASQTVLSGSMVTFNVGATGIGTLGYQWQANNGGGYTNLTDGGIISGSATSTLTLTSVTTNMSLTSYQVIITNANGSVTSSPAILTVLPTTELINVDIGTGSGTQTGAAVLGQPGDVWNVVSQDTISSVVDSASNTLSGVTIGDTAAGNYATPSPTVDAATAALMSDFNYNTPGSGPVPVTITGLGLYTNSAFILVVYAGMDPGQPCTINLTTGATGGNTANTLATTSATRKLSDGIGVAYNEFTGTLTNGTLTFTVSGASYHGPNGFQLLLSPTVPPVITNNPTSTTNYTGTTATFSVAASTASGTLTYQWQATNSAAGGFTNLVDGGNVSGSTASTLSLASVTINQALAYQVIVSNGSGSVTSTVASLTIYPSTNAYLTSLTLSPALTFTPGFASNGLSYAATEVYGSTPTVTVTNADLTATNQLVYNGTTNLLASGAASSPLSLTLGVTNVVTVQVTAQDGVTMQTYTVNVTELPNQATPPGLTNSVSNGTLNLTWGLDRLGYRLLVQTNNLNLGVSTNPNDWATVPSSTVTNQMAIPITTTNLNEYYRLVYP